MADKVQELNIAATKRIITNFKKDSETRHSLAYFETRLEKLREQWKNCEERHPVVYTTLGKETELIRAYSSEYEALESLVMEYMTLFREKVYEFKNHKESAATESVKLERIRIPTFNGRYSSWFGFRDLYRTMVHDNGQLSPVQKLQYLRNAVTDDAEKLISHLSVTDANYTVAWKLLCERYDNHQAIAQEVLQRFWDIQRCGSNDVNGFKRVLDVTHQLEACLQTIGGKSFDMMMIFILNQKLDEESRKDWQKKISGETGMPTLSSFLDFVQQRLVVLEALSGNLKMTSKKVVTVHTTPVEVKISCPKCKNGHRLWVCDAFKQMEVQARRNLASSKQLCFNCLSDKHKVTCCSSKHKCKLCGKRHHSLLHSDEAKKVLNNTTEIKAQCVQANHAAKRTNVLLSTALIKVRKQSGEVVTLRALLDSGAQRSFVTSAAVRYLGFQPKPASASILGVGGNQGITSTGMISITALAENDGGIPESIVLKPLVLEKITSSIPSVQASSKVPDGLTMSDLADPAFNVPSEIDVLIGADIYGRILLPGFISGNPSAQKTKFGWVLFGPTTTQAKAPSVNAFISWEELDNHLRQFFEIEDIDEGKRNLTSEEMQAEKIFTETTRRTEAGRYVVSLPFKAREDLPLCETYNTAYKQFRRLENALTHNPDLYRQYKEFMNEYLSLGHMELISPGNEGVRPAYYLPHHAVVKSSRSTTKLRVVFNASQRGAGKKALNDILLTGPSIQQPILHLLMRWRQHRYVMAADIEKMYRQIWVDEDDLDCQRILWRFSCNEPIRHYRLKTVTYGTSCAPFLAIRTLQQLAKDEHSKYPRAAEVIMKDFYVDDVLTGGEDLETLLQLQTDLRRIMQAGGFHLRKWTANHPDLLDCIPHTDRESQIPFDISVKGAVKTLGLQWHPATDDFTFSINRNIITKLTKRNVLSEVFKLFDPLGWIQPCIIIGKIAIRNLWEMKCDWDDTLQEKDVQEWLTVHKQLPALNKLRIPRWIGFTTRDQIELHGFCDASKLAFAAAVYIKVTSASSTRVTLLTSKSKVAPAKEESIPRLELLGAELLVELMDQVTRAHDWKHVPTFYWSDSSTVLDWIRSPASRWKVFVANRVGFIQRKSSSRQWYHVTSKENPADYATRGIYPKDLLNLEQWWNGPIWLKTATDLHCGANQPEEASFSHHAALELDASDQEPEILQRFSCINKLKRVVALCLRFKHNATKPLLKRTGFLTPEELQTAETLCIRLAQAHSFQNELKQLMRSNQISTNSHLQQLAPWLDTEGVLRVGGRIYHALVGKETKHPAIIPKGSLAKLLIRNAHLQTLHGGVQLTLSTLRLKYWILSGYTMTRSILKACIPCFKMTAKPNEQFMGSLPPARVQFESPFLETGVDYAGPINIRWSSGRGSKTTKAYVVVFVCMATKAFHLELASDLSATTCLAAIRRFIARRGKCKTFYSDCGTNFRGVHKLLQKDYEQATQEAASVLAQEHIQWKFIPPGSPHFGGLWEAGVKSMKRHLHKTIGQQILTIEEFNTLLAQIEACLNSRPLTDVSSDPSDVSALTPGHFLTGSNLFEIKSDPCESSVTLLKRWQLVQYMKHSFWHRWSRDYLNRLQQRPKWLTPQRNIQEGDIVLVKTANIPSMQWPLARVVATHPGIDGLVRVVTLKINGKFIKRAITKVCTLPFNNISHESSNGTNNQLETPSQPDKPAEIDASTTANKRQPPVEDRTSLKRRKITPISTATVLFSTLLVLGTCFTPTLSTVNVSLLQGSLYVEHIGVANLLRGALKLNFKLPLADLKYDEENIKNMNASIRTACTSAKLTNNQINCWELYQHLSELCQESLSRINTLRFLHSRKPRGILGQLLTSVFGVNDDVIMDINKLGENQEKLKQLVLRQGKIVLKATSTLNSTTTRINNKLSRFSEQLQKSLTEINKAKEWFTKVDHNQLNIRFLALYEHAKNYINDVFHKYNSILQTIYTKQGIWECVKLADLETAIYSLQPLLTAHLEVLHTTTTKVGTSYEDDHLVITSQLPIIDNRKYDLVKASAIPIQKNQNIFSVFEIASSILGVNYNDELYFETTEEDVFQAQTIHNSQYLLSTSTLINMKMKPNCIIREVYNTYADATCPTKTFKLAKLVWKELTSPNSWLFATPSPTPAQSVCDGIRTNILLNGTGILRITPDCTISAAEYTLTPRIHTELDFPVYVTPITVMHNLSDESTVNFHLNISTIIPTTSEFSSLVAEQEDVLASLKTTQWHVIQHHGMTAATTTVTTCVLMGIALIVWYCRNRPTATVTLDNNTSNLTWYDEHQL